jgi:tetratricopeptide (TPR) repeat protein
VFASISMGSGRGSETALAEAIAIADRLEDLDLRVGLRHTRGMAAWTGGELSAAETVHGCDEGISLARERPTAGFAVTGINPVVLLWTTRGVAESMRDRREESLRSFERAIDLARQLEDVIAEAPARCFFVHPAGCEDLIDPAAVQRHAGRLAEIAERTGATGPVLFAHWALGIACWRTERYEEAVSHLEGMLKFSEEQVALPGARAFGNAELAQAWLALDPKRARAAIERALTLRRTCWDGARIDLVDARVRLACGEREAAAAAVARGRALMRRLEAPSYAPEFDRVAAELDHGLR